MILVFQNDTSLVYGDDFTNILHIFICATCDGMTWKLIIFNFPKSKLRKPLNRLCSPKGIVTKAILSISYTLDALFLRMEQNFNAKALFLQISDQKTADHTKHAQQ